MASSPCAGTTEKRVFPSSKSRKWEAGIYLSCFMFGWRSTFRVVTMIAAIILLGNRKRLGKGCFRRKAIQKIFFAKIAYKEQNKGLCHSTFWCYEGPYT